LKALPAGATFVELTPTLTLTPLADDRAARAAATLWMPGRATDPAGTRPLGRVRCSWLASLGLAIMGGFSEEMPAVKMGFDEA